MKKALLTGATSYPGLALARRLMSKGIEVHTIVRPSSELSRLHSLPVRPVVHTHDGLGASLVTLVEQAAPDVIFHLAGQYVRDHRLDDVSPLITNNVLFGAQLLEAARQTGVRQFVNTGSYFQYCDAVESRAINLYAATKEAFADILDFYVDAHGLLATTLVLFDTYGPGDWRPRLMAAVHDAQATGIPVPLPAEDVPLDFVYIDDVTKAFVHAARLLIGRPEEVSGRRFAVRSETPQTIREIVTLFEAIGGRPVPQSWGAYPMMQRTMFRLWQGPTLPGWKAEITLREGIRRFIDNRRTDAS